MRCPCQICRDILSRRALRGLSFIQSNQVSARGRAPGDSSWLRPPAGPCQFPAIPFIIQGCGSTGSFWFCYLQASPAFAESSTTFGGTAQNRFTAAESALMPTRHSAESLPEYLEGLSWMARAAWMTSTIRKQNTTPADPRACGSATEEPET